MAKWEVSFDVRKGSAITGKSKTVEAESESMAVRLAEAQLKSSSSPAHRDEYNWTVRSVKRK